MNCRIVVSVGLMAGLLLGSADDASAQIRRTHWGLSASFTPSWKVPDYAKKALDAESVTLEGTTIRVGFVRGEPRRGEWGLSFVRRSFKDGAVVVRENETVTLDAGATMVGGEVGGYSPFGTIKDRVQIGIAYAIGAGVMQGTAVRTPTGAPAETVEAKTFFTVFDTELPVVPIVRLELVGAVIVGRGVKVRITGGLDAPGQAVFTVGASYFFGAR